MHSCENQTHKSKLWLMSICFILLSFMIVNINAMACDSCGRECSSACGTKHFRTCCFNYLRKRSDPTILKVPQSSLSSVSMPISELENNPGFLINTISDEQIYDPNVNYRVFEQILDDIRHDSKSLEMEVRRAFNIRKAEYDDKKHRLEQQKRLQQQQQQQLQQNQLNIPAKEIDY